MLSLRLALCCFFFSAFYDISKTIAADKEVEVGVIHGGRRNFFKNLPLFIYSNWFGYANGPIASVYIIGNFSD